MPGNLKLKRLGWQVVIDIHYRGRLGNKMVQFAAGYILAKKSGLSLADHPKSLDRFKIKLSPGESYSDKVHLNDTNYYEHLNNPLFDTGYVLSGFFQDARLLCDYRNDIIRLYQFDKQPKIITTQKDCFVHARIGDLLNNPNRNMAYFQPDYLEQQLETVRNSFDAVYISSDTIDYPPLVELIDKYDLTVYQSDPLDTILFAKNFDNLILSAGSFSYWMAYLSEANNITVYGKVAKDPLQRNNAWNYNKNVKFSL